MPSTLSNRFIFERSIIFAIWLESNPFNWSFLLKLVASECLKGHPWQSSAVGVLPKMIVAHEYGLWSMRFPSFPYICRILYAYCFENFSLSIFLVNSIRKNSKESSMDKPTPCLDLLLKIFVGIHLITFNKPLKTVHIVDVHNA